MRAQRWPTRPDREVNALSNIKGPDGAQRSDHEFERIVQQYQTALLRMCCLYLRDCAMAEDAVQETFIKVYRSMGSFRGESSEKTWIMRIALNTCRDMRRSGWFRLFDRRVPMEQLPEASVPFTAEEDSLIGEVMKLPFRLREVILLYYYQDMNVNEIANSLGLSQSSVSGRLKRGRDKLKTALEGRGFHE